MYGIMSISMSLHCVHRMFEAVEQLVDFVPLPSNTEEAYRLGQ